MSFSCILHLPASFVHPSAYSSLNYHLCPFFFADTGPPPPVLTIHLLYPSPITSVYSLLYCITCSPSPPPISLLNHLFLPSATCTLFHPPCSPSTTYTVPSSPLPLSPLHYLFSPLTPTPLLHHLCLPQLPVSFSNYLSLPLVTFPPPLLLVFMLYHLHALSFP